VLFYIFKLSNKMFIRMKRRLLKGCKHERILFLFSFEIKKISNKIIFT